MSKKPDVLSCTLIANRHRISLLPAPVETGKQGIKAANIEWHEVPLIGGWVQCRVSESSHGDRIKTGGGVAAEDPSCRLRRPGLGPPKTTFPTRNCNAFLLELQCIFRGCGIARAGDGDA